MANYTTNLHLEKPEYNETADIEIINQNMEKIDSEMTYKTATGTGTEITLSLPDTFGNGYNTTFIAGGNNGGAATTINGKPLYKPNTTTPPNITSGKAYSIWYNAQGDCFFLKASAEGDADVSHVLATKKFSNDNDTGLVGTMPNNGALNGSLNAGGSFNIPAGYTDGGTITANSLASQTQATAQAGDILSGETAIVNGNKITGNISRCGNIGSPDGNGFDSLIGGNAANQYVGRLDFKNLPRQYIEGDMTIHIKDLLPQYIVSGVRVGGVNGILGSATVQSMGGRRYAEGSVYANYDCKSGTINLPFTPRVVLMQLPDKIYVSSIWTNVMEPIKGCYAVDTSNYNTMNKATTSTRIHIAVGTNAINWTINDWSAGKALKYYAWE